jgi:hypothetical protein
VAPKVEPRAEPKREPVVSQAKEEEGMVDLASVLKGCIGAFLIGGVAGLALT